MHRADQYRRMAEDMRARAQRASAPAAIEEFLTLARAWDRLAEEADGFDARLQPEPLQQKRA